MNNITITLSGFKTKAQAILWLEEYAGAIEQAFDNSDMEGNVLYPAMTVTEQYHDEIIAFESDSTKLNFNLELQ